MRKIISAKPAGKQVCVAILVYNTKGNGVLGLVLSVAIRGMGKEEYGGGLAKSKHIWEALGNPLIFKLIFKIQYIKMKSLNRTMVLGRQCCSQETWVIKWITVPKYSQKTNKKITYKKNKSQCPEQYLSLY